MVRVIGEDQVVAEADRLVCNTDIEARELLLPPRVSIARRLVEDWYGEPAADLLYYAFYARPLARANELVGDLLAASKHPEGAEASYEREIKFSRSETARAKLVALLLTQNKFDAAQKLAGDAAFAKNFPPQQKLALSAKLHRWGEMWLSIAALEKSLWQPMPLMLAFVAGLAWLGVAVQAIQPLRAPGFRFTAPLLAVLAGALSTIPTLFLVEWQKEIMGLRQIGDFVGDLPFYFAGVGPREELIKLLFFMPFTPVLLSRRSRLEMLIVAGCTGLGFAIAENLLYFTQAGASAAFGRFLTANFFHFAATGLLGLAFCDLLQEPLKKAAAFLGTLCAVVLAHGVYDAFIGVVEPRIFGMASMISFMLLSLTFFRKLRTLRDGSTDQLALSATFVLGISALAAAMLVAASREIGFATALACLAVTGFGLVMIFFMFYWQLGDGMSEPDAPARPYLT